MTPRDEYRELYARLFELVFAGRWWSDEADAIRRRIDAMPPRDKQLPPADEIRGLERPNPAKDALGWEVGWELYGARVYPERKT